MSDSPQPERREPSRDAESIELGELPPRDAASGATPQAAEALADSVKGGRLRSESPPTGPIPIPYPNT